MKEFIQHFLYIRQVLRRVYALLSTYVIMAAKTAAAYAVFQTVNRFFPYRHILCRSLIVWAFAILCSILPWNYIVVFGALFLLGQMTAFSLEISAFLLVLLVILAVLKYLMLPGCGIVVAILPLLCLWKIPYVVPLLVGLAGTLSSFVSVGSGLMIYYVLKFAVDNGEYFADESVTLVQRLLFLVKGFLGNEEMILTVAVFCFVTILVHLVSRSSVDYAHPIALAVGTVFTPVLLKVSMDFAELPGGPVNPVWGSLLAFALALLYDLFRMGLNYSKTEHVQFEDDDYYYFVKAVPKIGISEELRPHRDEMEESRRNELMDAVEKFGLPVSIDLPEAEEAVKTEETPEYEDLDVPEEENLPVRPRDPRQDPLRFEEPGSVTHEELEELGGKK